MQIALSTGLSTVSAGNQQKKQLLQILSHLLFGKKDKPGCKNSVLQFAFQASAYWAS